MSVTVNPPKTPVTEGSNGVATATVPNVCKMPGPPAPFVPTPLPNIGRSGLSPKDYSQDVTIEGHKIAIRGATFKSMGDVASQGTGGGIVSSNTEGPTRFVGPGSMDVKVEGKNVQLLGDPMLNNCGPSGSPANAATMVGVLQETGLAALYGDEQCPLCGKKGGHGDAGKLEETEDTQGDSDVLNAAAKRAVEAAQQKRQEILDREKERIQQEVDEAYAAKKELIEKNLRTAQEKQNAKGIEFQQKALDRLGPAPRVVTDEEVAELVPRANLATMLGVVRCKGGKVCAGKSSGPVTELAEQVPAGWHTPKAGESIFDKTVVFGRKRDDFKKHVRSQDAFSDQWEELQRRSEAWNDTKEGQPYYPPGQCAAQQLMLLAMDHHGEPVGLTERWFSSDNPEATVTVAFRANKDAEPQLGAFGGKNAVPPCGTCEVILTMLVCPDEKPEEQAWTPPAEEGVCRCKP